MKAAHRDLGPAAAGLALAVALLASPAARADSIDGDWCNGPGKVLQIKGPQILTPDGKRLQGDYTRHGFSYTDQAILTQMTLLNEQTMHLRRAASAAALAQAAPETWKRCQGAVSDAATPQGTFRPAAG